MGNWYLVKAGLLVLLIWGGLLNPALANTDPDSLLEETHQLWQTGKFEKAIELTNHAYEIFTTRNDSAGIAEAYAYYTNTYRMKENFEMAVRYGKKILDLADEIYVGENVLHTLNNLGAIARTRGDLDQALEYYNMAEEYIDEDDPYEAFAVTALNTGTLHHSREYIEEAIQEYNRAIGLAKTFDDEETQAIALGNLAQTHRDLGDFEVALDLFMQQRELLEEMGDTYRKVNLMNSLGYTYRKLGEYDRSLRYYALSLELAEDLDLTNMQIRINNNIAQVYSVLNQYDRAHEYYTANMEMFDEINSLALQRILLNNIASVHSYEGDFDLSLYYNLRSLDKAYQTENNERISNSYSQIANLYYNNNEIDSSYHHANQALHYGRKSELVTPKVRAKLRIARIYSSKDNQAKMADYLSAAKDIAQTFEDPNLIELYSEAVLDLTDPDDPHFFEVANTYISAIETRRQHIRSSGDLRSSYFAKHADRFKQIAEAYLDNGDIETAFEVLELSRARVLLEEMKQAHYARDDVPEEEHVRSLVLEDKILETYEQLEADYDQEVQDSLRRRLSSLQTEHELVQASLLDETTERMQITPIGMNELTEWIGQNTAVFTFAETNDHILAIAVLGERHEAWKIDLNTDQNVNELLEHFRTAIVEELPTPVVNRYGLLLSKQLLEPARPLIEQADHMIVSADGNLATLPFEALTWNGSYLISDLAVSQIPSLTALKLRDYRTPPSFEKDIFKLANPDFESHEIDDALVMRRSGQRLDPLPASQIEADRIGELFELTSMLSRKNANKQNLEEVDFSRFRFLHFATHGLIHREFPEMSGLALSRGDGRVQFLRSREIAQMNISCEMVVLSACETAVGPQVTGEGMLGLQRAFLIAGTQTVVASLWRVYDQSTSALMIRFYEKLIEQDGAQAGWFNFFNIPSPSTVSKADAMRSAKINMINSPNYFHPVHWAAFQVVGY